MKTGEWFRNKLESLKDGFEFRLETLILDLTEKVCIKMEEKNINRKKLSDLLDVSPPAVTKILNGNSNFTLKTLLSLSDALDLDLRIDFVEKATVYDGVYRDCSIDSITPASATLASATSAGVMPWGGRRGSAKANPTAATDSEMIPLSAESELRIAA